MRIGKAIVSLVHYKNICTCSFSPPRRTLLIFTEICSQKRNPNAVFPHKCVSWTANPSSQGVFLRSSSIRRIKQQLCPHSMSIRHRHSSLGTVKAHITLPFNNKGVGTQSSVSHPAVGVNRKDKTRRNIGLRRQIKTVKLLTLPKILQKAPDTP